MYSPPLSRGSMNAARLRSEQRRAAEVAAAEAAAEVAAVAAEAALAEYDRLSQSIAELVRADLQVASGPAGPAGEPGITTVLHETVTAPAPVLVRSEVVYAALAAVGGIRQPAYIVQTYEDGTVRWSRALYDNEGRLIGTEHIEAPVIT